ncbi:uracil phosphoribosyltransferase [Listeria rustica]|uniref:Uracil phosphoribosyltransferase n=1 Tax=Listeria rustica TaxID=2713503 RepID=A0A7W1T5N7_9LIST|nr:uracil phosphoribosyltransferase [Listeria rustica]MBA3925925.1 uracil phosphoribosyltransferase [Listeria rustica]
MAISQAKKARMKRVREGNLDPSIHRSAFATLDLRTKRTKTKQAKLNQKKYKPSYSNTEQDSLYFLFV